MDVIVERQSALDVHKAQVTACVRVPGADGQRVQQRRAVQDDRARAAGVGGLAQSARGDACRDGGHRRLLEARLAFARGRLRADARQRPSCQTGPRPQDRRVRRGVVVVKHSMICACWHMLATGELSTTSAATTTRAATPNARRNASSPSSTARTHRHAPRGRIGLRRISP